MYVFSSFSQIPFNVSDSITTETVYTYMYVSLFIWKKMI